MRVDGLRRRVVMSRKLLEIRETAWGYSRGRGEKSWGICGVLVRGIGCGVLHYISLFTQVLRGAVPCVPPHSSFAANCPSVLLLLCRFCLAARLTSSRRKRKFRRVGACHLFRRSFISGGESKDWDDGFCSFGSVSFLRGLQAFLTLCSSSVGVGDVLADFSRLPCCGLVAAEQLYAQSFPLFWGAAVVKFPGDGESGKRF
ncbi:hypothetical protein IWZ01DRAFT_173514 [Phyllosticta capitalensis]